MEYFDPNKVYFGFDNVHIVPFADDSTPNNPKWSDDIIPIPGAVNFAPTANNSEMNFFADNIRYFSVFLNNGYDGTLEIAKVPVEVFVQIYRYIVDTNGILLGTSATIYRNYAMMFEIQGDKNPIRQVWYSCSSGLPSTPHETMSESSTPDTQSMDISASPITFSNGKKITYAQCPMNTESPETMAIYNNWFKGVYVPSFEDNGIEGFSVAMGGLK